VAAQHLEVKLEVLTHDDELRVLEQGPEPVEDHLGAKKFGPVEGPRFGANQGDVRGYALLAREREPDQPGGKGVEGVGLQVDGGHAGPAKGLYPFVEGLEGGDGLVVAFQHGGAGCGGGSGGHRRGVAGVPGHVDGFDHLARQREGLSGQGFGVLRQEQVGGLATRLPGQGRGLEGEAQVEVVPEDGEALAEPGRIPPLLEVLLDAGLGYLVEVGVDAVELPKSAKSWMAVLSPMPFTPGMLSAVSPTKASQSAI